MDTIDDAWNVAESAVSFCADVMTLVLGVIALWAIVRNRGRIEFLFRVLYNRFLNDRSKRIVETLGKLDSLDYENKGHRKEVFALLGQLSGQVEALGDRDERIGRIHSDLMGFLNSTVRLSEAKKRRVTQQVHAALDHLSLESTTDVLESEHE